MLKISITEGPGRCRLVMEGKLVGPWVMEFKTACERARAELRGREFIVHVNDLTAISQEGENVLFELMSQGVKFRCRGVFTKHVLQQVAHRASKEL